MPLISKHYPRELWIYSVQYKTYSPHFGGGGGGGGGGGVGGTRQPIARDLCKAPQTHLHRKALVYIMMFSQEWFR